MRLPPPRPRREGGKLRSVHFYPAHDLRDLLIRRARQAGHSLSVECTNLVEAALAQERADSGDPADALEVAARARSRELGISQTVARKLVEKEAASGIS